MWHGGPPPRPAHRPLMVLGGGALSPGVAELVGPLAEAVGAGVATTFSGKGCIDEGHPLAVGLLSTMGATSAARAAEQADLLLLVGTKAGSGATLGWSLPRTRWWPRSTSTRPSWAVTSRWRASSSPTLGGP